MIVLGGGRVGKTSILQQFIIGQFNPESITTRAKSEYTKNLEVPNDYNEELQAINAANLNGSTACKLELWDTAG